MCFPVLAKRQICVQGDLPGAQSQRKNLVWQKEKSSLPWLSLASPSHIFSNPLPSIFEIPSAKSSYLFKWLNFCVGMALLFWISKRLESLPAFA